MKRTLPMTLSLSLVLVVLVGIATILMLNHLMSTPPQTATTTTPPPAPPPPPPFEFPDGDRTLSDHYRFVALYGSVETPVLGALGEQNIDASIARVKQLAKQYQSLTKQHVYPAFEIIATVAAGSPTADGDYSHQTDSTKLKPWVVAAKKAGVYVLLDLQPGRSSFLAQAKQYQSLLSKPHVGLALDPEWRLAPNEYPLGQIGHVSASEVNQTSTWLSQLVTDHDLPQKLFLIHQFHMATLPDRSKLQTHDNLMTVIQMDGQGSQLSKQETWRAVGKDLPPGIVLGWKNFYDEDSPTLTPAKTMAVNPQPWYVSYQ